MEHVERMQKRLKAEQPDATKRLAALQRQRVTLKSAIARYFTAFETAPDPDVAVLDRVRELRAELQDVEAELARQETRTAPVKCTVSPERVKLYLEKLRERIASRSAYQRAVFQELKRTHDFDVRVAPSGREFTLSLALPSGELMANGTSSKRLISVVTIPGEKHDRQVCGEVSGSSAPLTLGQKVRIGGTVRLATRSGAARGEAKAWAAAEDAKGYMCACGCGGRIRVTSRQFKTGVPKWLREER